MPTQDFHASHYDLSAEDDQSVEKNNPQHSSTTDHHSVEIVQDLLGQRYSCRYFLKDKIPKDEILKQILLIAKNAPSGSNFQPWKVHILRGKTKENISKHVQEAHSNHSDQYQSPYTFYPHNSKLSLPEFDHLAKRRANFGKQFYAPLNIDRKDVEARKQITARNWSFFDAPIGFLITTISDAPQGAYLDTGFFVMSLIIALRSFGLECCVQEAHATFHEVYANHLQFPKNESVVCGLAVGYPDMEKVLKFSGKQEKMSLEELAVFYE